MKTFARDLVLYIGGDFLVMYIYANSNRVSYRVLEWGVSGKVAELALFNV